MPPIYSLYVGLLIASLLISVLLFFLILKHCASGAVQAYLVFVFLSSGVGMVTLFSMYSQDVTWAVWWHGNLRFAMLGLITPLTFVFTSVLLEPAKGLFKSAPWWLFPVPIVTALLSLTNDSHHWVFRDYRMVNEFGLFLRMAWNPGPWFLVHLVNSYAVGLFIVWLLMGRLSSLRRLPRFRGTLALGIVALTFLTNGLDVLGLNLVPGLLWTPLGLGLVNLVILIGAIYLDLFDVLPVARETLFRYMTEAVFILDPDDHLVEVNPVGEEILQTAAKSWKGRSIYDLVDASQVQSLQQVLRQSQSRGEVSFVLAQKVHWFEVSLSAIYLEGGLLGAKLVIARDITQQKEFQQREYELATHLERQRLARELHDAVSQTLFSARLTAETLLRQKDELPPAALGENLQLVTRLIVSALGEMRILLLELRPDGLATTALSSLLTYLVEAMGARTSARLGLSLQGEGKLPEEVNLALYRIAQEALSNCVKYSHASEINLALMQSETGVKLTIVDNGRGFSVSSQEDDHFGISIMRERAAEIGARLEISSQAGEGTSLTCDWPGEREP